MEQTALRPKSMPGSGGRTSTTTSGPEPPGDPLTRPAAASRPGRPHAARRRGRRLCSVLCGLLCAVVLVLAGIGLGTVGATVIGMSKLAELKRQAPPAARPAAPPPSSSAPTPGPTTAPTPPASPLSPLSLLSRGGLGVEVVDAPKASGALVVAVHIPGPGYTGGLVRGDVLVGLGGRRVGSALDLAAHVADVADNRPGRQVVITVRHANGELQKLAVTPGVLT
ncbi:PDZ domain-containing protein [Streptomyces endophyticus]|uniref:PDZ domain-containing protein n=1 Tax=Streptomyces endophyticus TaxID=714166 RepID=A0ABU6F5X7_9ACTN|nr:PDZ domain-containing protein [Streptomyces endophyticus]MEB8339229.1 PDZ domain-containing protein [Streptomyces endophyticus]